MTALLSLTELGQRLPGGVPAAQTSVYQGWLNSVDAAVRNYVHWGIEEVVGSIEYYDGTGSTFLPLRTPFVKTSDATTSLSVYHDATGAYGFGPTPFAAATKLTLGTDYAIRVEGARSKSAVLNRLTNINNTLWFPSDIFYRPPQPGGLALNKGPYWPAGLGNIKVVCTYGFSTIPEDIKDAMVRFIAVIRAMASRGVLVTSESLADYSYSGALTQMLEMGSVRQLLSPYRDIAI